MVVGTVKRGRVPNALHTSRAQAELVSFRAARQIPIARAAFALTETVLPRSVCAKNVYPISA